MKRKLLIVVFALATIASLPAAFAADFTDWGFVTRVHAGYSGDQVYVKGLENKAGCTYSHIRFDPADGDPEKVETMALTALLTGQRIRCYVDGCTPDGKYQRGYRCHLMK